MLKKKEKKRLCVAPSQWWVWEQGSHAVISCHKEFEPGLWFRLGGCFWVRVIICVNLRDIYPGRVVIGNF